MTRPMSRRNVLTALLLPLFLGGCAALRPAPPPDRDAALHLTRGLDALEAGQYAGAYDQLAWVATHCPAEEAGLHARAGLAALELDPRNPVGRPEVGMKLLADLILGPATPSHLRPLAETTYLLGLGLGARPVPDTAVEARTGLAARPGEPRQRAGGQPQGIRTAQSPVRGAAADRRQDPVHGCGPALVATERVRLSLPELPGPSLAAMLARVEARERATTAEAERLRNELALLREQLEATQGELARIRRTLRP